MDSKSDVNKCNVIGYPSMNQNYPPPQHIQPGYSMPAYQAGYVPPYQGYGFPPNANNFDSHSFNMTYSAQNYGPWMPDSHNNNNSVNKFGRLMLVTMTTLIITMCMMSLVIWFLFGAEIPEIKVSTFSVSNLNISSSMIQASWDVNVTVLNTNPNLRVHSGPVQISIAYNNVPLLTSTVEPFSLEGNQQLDVNLKLENQKSPCKEVIGTDMKGEEESGGTISFSMRVDLGVELYSTSVKRKESISVFCEDVKINMGPNGSGTLARDSPTQCLI